MATKRQEANKLHNQIRQLCSEYTNQHGFGSEKKTPEQYNADLNEAQKLRPRLEQLRAEIAAEKTGARAALLTHARELEQILTWTNLKPNQRFALIVAIELFKGTKNAGIKRAVTSAKNSPIRL